MDNLIYRDYASWKIKNHEMIETFQKNESVIYDRLDPVYTVLNHIYDLLVEEQKIDEDLDTIFIAGFNYLHSQLEIIKIYYEKLFQSKCDDFINYSEMVLYLLFIFDIRTDLENNEIDSDIEELNELETSIENINSMDRFLNFIKTLQQPGYKRQWPPPAVSEAVRVIAQFS